MEKKHQEEFKKNINIKVEYKNIPPNERVFEIDASKMEKAVEVMFKGKRKNLTVEVHPGLSNESGHYENGTIVIWQDELVRSAREWYGYVRDKMGDDPDSSYFIVEETKKPIYRMKDKLTFLPHKLAGTKDTPFLTVEQEKTMGMIIEMVRTHGDSSNGKDLASEILRDALKRNAGETLAHESEHGKNATKVMILGIGAFLVGVTAAMVTSQGLYQNNVNAYVALAAYAVAPILIVGSIIGINTIDEKKANQAEKDFFALFIDSININNEVFQKKVLDPTPPSN